MVWQNGVAKDNIITGAIDETLACWKDHLRKLLNGESEEDAKTIFVKENNKVKEISTKKSVIHKIGKCNNKYERKHQ